MCHSDKARNPYYHINLQFIVTAASPFAQFFDFSVLHNKSKIGVSVVYIKTANRQQCPRIILCR